MKSDEFNPVVHQNTTVVYALRLHIDAYTLHYVRQLAAKQRLSVPNWVALRIQEVVALQLAELPNGKREITAEDRARGYVKYDPATDPQLKT
jgi:hypothetical protein